MNATSRTVEVLYSIGHRLIGLERHGDALSLFRTMLLVDPCDERGWVALATCHEALEENEKAIAICHLGETACGGRAFRCMIARARLYRTLGATDEASATYEQALRLAEVYSDEDARALIEREREAA